MLCIPATQYVKVCCSEYQSSASCIEALKLLQEYDIADKKAKVDFMEGFGFASDSFAVVKGSFVTNKEREESKCIPIVHCNRHGSRWFFNSVRDSLRKISRSLKGSPYNVGPTADVGSDLAESSTREISFLMTTKDYLFRHDRGSFWMASYRIPQIVGQWLMGSLLDSTNMFKLATALPWAFPKSVIVLQDFMLPFDNVDYFVNTLEEKLDLWPIWLLPMKNHQKANKALFGVPRSLSSHLCNVGAYGIPRKKYNFIPDNQMLEKLLHKCNGRKVFYSHAFYERNFFYEELYPGKEYFKLRRKYVSDESLPEIFDKVVTKNGKL